MSLELLGTPSAPPPPPASSPPPLPASAPPPAENLEDTSDEAAIDAGLAALDSELVASKKHDEEVIDADDLAEFVDGDDDLQDA